MIVVDASVVATALAVQGIDGDEAREHLRHGGQLHAPHLMDLEVTSVLRRRQQAGNIDGRQVGAAFDALRDLPVIRYRHFPLVRRRIWELRSNLTPYDAAYVALAETLRCPLLTGDRRLERAPGIRCQLWMA